MRYPDNLKANDTLGVTATSAGVNSSYDNLRLDLAIKNFQDLGYNIVETSNTRKNKKFVSSSPKERALEFMNLWKNPKVKGIFQVKGGEFLMEMLPYLDKDVLLKSKPKWVTGYSDASLLNFYLTTNFEIVTATGANFLHFAMSPLDTSLKNQLELLEGTKDTLESYPLYEDSWRPLEKDNASLSYLVKKKVALKSLDGKKEVSFEGVLIGGCLEALATLLGTSYDKTLEFVKKQPGVIWYLEVYEASPLEVYRLLWQMKEAKWFTNTKGFLIGRTRAPRRILDFTYLEALHKIFDDFKVPVIYDVDIGHLMPTWTILNGSYGIFKYQNKKGSLKMVRKD